MRNCNVDDHDLVPGPTPLEWHIYRWNCFECYFVVNDNTIHICDYKAVVVFEACALPSFQALIKYSLNISVIIASQEDFEVGLPNFICQGKSLSNTIQQIITHHKVLHCIRKLWNWFYLIFWKLEKVNLIAVYYLKCITVWSELNEPWIINSVILIPFYTAIVHGILNTQVHFVIPKNSLIFNDLVKIYNLRCFNK